MTNDKEGNAILLTPDQNPNGVYIKQRPPHSINDLIADSGCCNVAITWHEAYRPVCSACSTLFTGIGAKDGEQDFSSSLNFLHASREDLEEAAREWISFWTGIPEEDLEVSIND